MKVVSDTSPLILFAQTGQLELLRGLFTEIAVPPAVWSEVGAHSDAPDAHAIQAAEWIRVVPMVKLAPPVGLGRGETEAIALAGELAAERILMDDRAGRRAAYAAGLRVMGSLGILALGHRRGLLAQPRAALRSMMGAGLWVSPKLAEDFEREIGI